jgi:hypothetical protein
VVVTRNCCWENLVYERTEAQAGVWEIKNTPSRTYFLREALLKDGTLSRALSIEITTSVYAKILIGQISFNIFLISIRVIINP